MQRQPSRRIYAYPSWYGSQGRGPEAYKPVCRRCCFIKVQNFVDRAVGWQSERKKKSRSILGSADAFWVVNLQVYCTSISAPCKVEKVTFHLTYSEPAISRANWSLSHDAWRSEITLRRRQAPEGLIPDRAEGPCLNHTPQHCLCPGGNAMNLHSFLSTWAEWSSSNWGWGS